MQITNEKVVTLMYELTVTDADGEKELIETVEQEDPMAFIQGMSGLPEAFEENIEGLSVGDTFEFSIPAEDGYGEYDPTAVVELPKDIFKVDGEYVEEMLEVGNYLPMTDDRGNQLNGRVLAVEADFVRMDFNHPLADKEMFFKGTILGVRDATQSEIEHGHVHGEGGVHH
ncbi:FKBP-type peptidyl-prolyl cis-trans isomerase SlyD [Arcicella aurantiaca]|uniref:Peptidyl-prolyl cis-trans isomerase n=1 Tax=Arcicella aurantiaca TaxID=591202 RepID=A0A316EAU1_9BACT|nr:peptidylprolyl isomerase [Arcicella aurantiaca]PWK27061.1 FKBP-type peptidyl-prolyl cis-trans isomerase SlyD [Arcicella aurantiaca]